MSRLSDLRDELTHKTGKDKDVVVKQIQTQLISEYDDWKAENTNVKIKSNSKWSDI